MYDAGKILIGLIIFLGFFTSPFWYDNFNNEATKTPDIVLPTRENQKGCVEGIEYMRSNHMILLNNWRQGVVREGKTTYLSSTGKKFDMSLEKSCLNCHSNASQFCNQCHNYLDVSLTCWSCHQEPGDQKSFQANLKMMPSHSDMSELAVKSQRPENMQ